MIGRVVVVSQLLYCIRICDEFAHEHEWIAPASGSEATYLLTVADCAFDFFFFFSF